LKTIGLNSGTTRFGKHLNDGSVCYHDGQEIKAIVVEERVSREKRDGGFKKATRELFNAYDLSWDDIDTIAYSSCCDKDSSPKFLGNTAPTNTNKHPVNHHLSHALSVYCLSPFKDAIIIVLDAGGNILSDDKEKWWEASREQSSYFIVRNNTIELISRDFEQPGEAGIGELFRAFTYFLGWGSSMHAGKTMALSSYGNPNRFQGMPIFNLKENGRVSSIIDNRPEKPLEMVKQALTTYGITTITERIPGEEITQDHKDIARWIQDEAQRVIDYKIKYFEKKYQINNFCLSGGVAYNCKMNGNIERTIKNINLFVGPAPGDQGQSLGNVLSLLGGPEVKISNFVPYCGLDRSKEIAMVPSYQNLFPDLSIGHYENVTRTAAELIASGEIICWFQGKSEFGARALGNRSILADPRNPKNRFILNQIKGRDHFMPFAPSVMMSATNEYFDCYGDYRYMTHALKVKPEMRKFIPAVVHIDGTSRIQSVDRKFNKIYHELISEFREITGIPLVLNTSFNRGGEPIVETVEDAIKSFQATNVNYLIVGDWVIEKNEKFKYFGLQESYYNTSLKILDDIKSDIDSKYDRRISIRQKFSLYEEFVDWLLSGRKFTTIRYSGGDIDFPSKTINSLYATDTFFSDSTQNYVFDIDITGITIKKFRELNEYDAYCDGFNSLKELTETLTRIYGPIDPEAYMTIYNIYPHLVMTT
jgi:carbamoyltransferase